LAVPTPAVVGTSHIHETWWPSTGSRPSYCLNPWEYLTVSEHRPDLGTPTALSSSTWPCMTWRETSVIFGPCDCERAAAAVDASKTPSATAKSTVSLMGTDPIVRGPLQSGKTLG
jgi:hypothetical protein